VRGAWRKSDDRGGDEARLAADSDLGSWEVGPMDVGWSWKGLNGS